jgi:hypothetical protein
MSKRDRYVEVLKARLDLWNAELDRLEATTSSLHAEAKLELERQAAELRRRRDEALERVRQIQHAQEGAWEDLKSGAEQAFNAVGEAFERARARFRQ